MSNDPDNKPVEEKEFESYVQQLAELIESYRQNGGKFYRKGNNVAGTRARKELSELAKVAKQARLHVQKTRKTDDD